MAPRKRPYRTQADADLVTLTVWEGGEDGGLGPRNVTTYLLPEEARQIAASLTRQAKAAERIESAVSARRGRGRGRP